MTRILFAIAFLIGALAVIWTGHNFIGVDTLGLSVIAVIGAVYAIGLAELVQFRRATGSLNRALQPLSESSPVDSIERWLTPVHASLHNAVRLRIEGERVALPGPIITPYLVGLLVMLGLLGTFVGMVDTLKGAVTALQGTTELEAIRSGLTAPIGGLSLAFGTSVAGVAASAMLGLMSTLSRRDRLQTSRLLDSRIHQAMRNHSQTYRQQQTFEALQAQSAGLPEVTQKLAELANHMARMSEQVGERLLNNQTQLQDSLKTVYQDLAESVGKTLNAQAVEFNRQSDAHAQATQAALQNSLQSQLQPMLQAAVQDIRVQLSASAEQTQRHMQSSIERQLATMADRVAETSRAVANAWQQGLADQQAQTQQLNQSMQQTLLELGETLGQQWQNTGAEFVSRQHDLLAQMAATAQRLSADAEQGSQRQLAAIQGLLERTEALVERRIENESQWLAQHEQRMSELQNRVQNELQGLREDERERATRAIERFASLEDSAIERLASLEDSAMERLTALEQAASGQLSALEGTVSRHIGQLGQTLEEPMTRLIQMASETPKAAAEVIGQLRGEISKNIERDNELLTERRRGLDELNELSKNLQTASEGQLKAVEQLVGNTDRLLVETAQRFDEQLGKTLVNVSEASDQATGSAVELASLGESFGVAVNLYNESNEKLAAQLQRIEAALAQSAQRSDEQLAYYVAQAREVIDHSLMSQKEIFEELRQLGQKKAAQKAPAEVS